MIGPAVGKRWRLWTASAIVTLAVFVPARLALAHVDLVESRPAAGGVFDAPVEELRLEFSTPATLTGDGVVVYDSNATPVPATTTVLSPTEVVVVPQEPLTNGAWAVTWSMQAPDAHPTEGGFEFTIAIPTPATTASDPEPATGPPESASLSILNDVLPGTPRPATVLGALARMLSIGGALIGIGSLAFALMVFEGPRHEARMIGYWIRRSGVAIVAAVPLELVATSMMLSGASPIGALAPANLATAFGGGLAVATGMRLAGGIALVAGTNMVVVVPDIHEPTPPPDSAVAVRARERLHVAASPGALIGAAMVAISFMFDGHTATAGPAPLVWFASLVHVISGATWVAGVCLLARILVGRHRRGEPLGAARLVIPFSTVAGAAVLAIGLAGTVLALSIVDGPGAFFTTAWGRTLLAKLALAGVAGGIGAYNHRFVVPAMRADPAEPMAEYAIRRTVRIEAGLLVATAITTAVLVGLSAT